ncbi:MAG: phosphotransferase [Fimbriimonadaceae bacterium]|nr:MAG: phosphotransferase [Fimbriimonadaceae bacterium]
MTPFAELTPRAQVALLRPYAAEFAAEYGLKPIKISLANHGFNTTFRIDTATKSYALRMNINSVRSLENLRAEIFWTSRLANSPVHAAKPVKAKNGDWILIRTIPSLPRETAVAVYEWLPGRKFPGIPSKATMKELGRVTRLLHENTEGLALPNDAALPLFEDVLLGKPLELREHGFTGDLGVMQAVVDEANAVVKVLAKKPAQIIHYDLHRYNIMKERSTLHVLDFDDCLLGWPMVDASVSMYYARTFKPSASFRTTKEPAYWQGFGSRPTDHGISERDFEALVASRRVMLCNELFQMMNADYRKKVVVYANKGAELMASFLKNGVYDPTTQ